MLFTSDMDVAKLIHRLDELNWQLGRINAALAFLVIAVAVFLVIFALNSFWNRR